MCTSNKPSKQNLCMPFLEALKSNQMTLPKYLIGNLNSTQSKLNSLSFQKPVHTLLKANTIINYLNIWKLSLIFHPIIPKCYRVHLLNIRHCPLLTIFSVPGLHHINSELQQHLIIHLSIEVQAYPTYFPHTVKTIFQKYISNYFLPQFEMLQWLSVTFQIKSEPLGMILDDIQIRSPWTSDVSLQTQQTACKSMNELNFSGFLSFVPKTCFLFSLPSSPG